MFAAVHGDIKALAIFSQKVKATLRREAIFKDCIEAGIPLHELLYRLLLLRLEPSSLVATHLKPVWEEESWRMTHFADTDAMMRFFIRHCLDKTALADAEQAFGQFRRRPSESGIALVIRLREAYDTASLAYDFTERFPEHILPEILVRSLDLTLINRVTDGLSKSCRPWRRNKLERENRTSPDQVRMILTKVQQEIDNQLSLWPRTTRPSGVTFQSTTPPRQRPRWGRPTPPPNRSETAYAALDTNEEYEYEAEWYDDGTDTLHAIGGPPNRPPPPSRPPMGIVGPPVPPASRFPRGPAGPRPPTPAGPRPSTPNERFDDSQRGRFTFGSPNYSGCHNCGDKQHMSKNCSMPLAQKLAALVESTTGWPTEVCESLLEQGFPSCLEECYEDPDAIKQYCLSVMEAATTPDVTNN